MDLYNIYTYRKYLFYIVVEFQRIPSYSRAQWSTWIQ